MSRVITKEVTEKALAEHHALQDRVVTKYLAKGEHNFRDVLARICTVAASCDFVAEDEAQDMVSMIQHGFFLPAGSILAGLGNPEHKTKKQSFSNCYLAKIEHDDIESIFEAVKKLARTYSYRGGSGIDITVLRPAGAVVHNAANTSSGAVSFMPMLSEVTNCIGQNGRRGALMISMDIRHPDAERFIWCKSRPEQVFGKDNMTGRIPDISGANISLKLTDAFMQAVIDDGDWTFVFPDRDQNPELYDTSWDGDYDKWAKGPGALRVYHTVKAREIMKQIAESAHACGDPGIMLIDHIQGSTPGTFIDAERLKPMSTNPCGEQPMAYWANCLLGAHVLSRYVKNPYTTQAEFDLKSFEKYCRAAVYFMNYVSDLNAELHPLPEQREADKYGKRIGIEVTGLGDMLAMLNLEYGSDQAGAFLESIFREKAIWEIEASCLLAEREKCCTALLTNEARESFIQCPYIQHLVLPTCLEKRIRNFGLANTAFNTIGPAGSISIMAGNVTSGMEPVFAFSYTRETRMEPGRVFDMIHMPVVEHLLSTVGAPYLGSTADEIRKTFWYREAQSIKPTDRLKMQAAVQKYTDSAVSSTINLPADCTVEDIEKIYIEAWVRGLKGVTVYRDGCKKGVLATKKEETFEKVEASQVQNIAPVLMDLQDIECGERHIVHWKGAKMFVFVSLLEDGSPVEVFALLPKEAGINGDGQYQAVAYQEKYSLWATITRFASLLLRMGTPVELVIKQLDKSSFAMVDAAGVLSRVLSHYISHEEKLDEAGNLVTLGQECPECQQKTFVHDGGCPTCRECGYTKCG